MRQIFAVPFIISSGFFASNFASAADNSTASNSTNNVITSTPVIVSASRFKTSIDTAPINITTITEEDISRSNASNLSDILEMEAGIDVSNLYGISGSRARVDMGGFGDAGSQNTLVLLNGRRLNDVDLQGANFSAIPLDSIARIEIVHGTSTVLYGDNAVGGVINIVTKNGFDGKQGKVKLQVGSFQTQRLSGDLRTNNNDSALSLAFDGMKSNGYRDNSDFDNFSLISEISKQHNDKNYGARLNASREKLQLPGALDEATFKSDPTATTFTTEQAKERRFSLEGYYSGNNLAGELTLSKKHQEATIFGDTSANLTTLSFTPRYKHQYDKNKIVAGIDIYHSRLETNAEFTNFSPPPANVTNSSDTVRNSFAIYAADTIDLDNTTSMHFGMRHQQVNLDIKNNGNISGKSKDSSSNGVNAVDFTMSHQYKYGGLNYIRLAHSFRSPVLDEMWNYYSGNIALLDPQTADHLEVGTRQKFSSGLNLKANIFVMSVSKEIAYDGTANVNLDKTRHSGLDVDINYPINRKLTVTAGLAGRKASFIKGANKGNTVPLVPNTKITLSGDYQLTESDQLRLDIIRTGQRYFGNDFANAGKQMEAYNMVNMSYSKQFNHWKAHILIQNLANVSVANIGFYAPYLAPAPPYTYYPLPERAVYITFEGDM
jgi:iron complex outermembrane receptor protein